MASYQNYKENISIAEVAESLGYQFNRKAGRHPMEYKHPVHNTIVISNRNGIQVYFTRHESGNRGSVIDFVKHRLNQFNLTYAKETEGINKVLASFAAAIPKSSKRDWFQHRKSFNINHYRVKSPGIDDLVYLSHDRGLRSDTLETFLPHIQLIYRKGTTDIAFPYRIPGIQNIVGLELVNFMFKGHARGSNRAEGVWQADLTGTGFPPKVFIGESAIDAMSFYQLFRQKFQLDQAAFVSSGGYITDKQIEGILRQHPRARIHTIFDNDLSGHLYAIRTACKKANKDLKIYHDEGMFKFVYHNKATFMLERDQVSLTNFRRLSNMRDEIRVHKARGKDFNEMLMPRTSAIVNRRRGC